MIHPSYTELLNAVNSGHEEDTPVVNSRYSIVMAAAKRARQIVSGEANVTEKEARKPLSTAVAELYSGKVRILQEQIEDEKETELKVSEMYVDSDDGYGYDDEADPADSDDEEDADPEEED